jgi:trimeric autotransporter adhesin
MSIRSRFVWNADAHLIPRKSARFCKRIPAEAPSLKIIGHPFVLCILLGLQLRAQKDARFIGQLQLSSGVSVPIISTYAGSDWQYPGGLRAINSPLGWTAGVTADASGNIYVADVQNDIVVRVGADGSSRVVAGNGIIGFSGDGGAAINASLAFPQAVAVDATGNLYITDSLNNRVRKVSDGNITTVAGNGVLGFSGDGGPAVDASLNQPGGLALDSVGRLYIADRGNNRVRMISEGTISTVAGSGNRGFSGDGVLAVNAELSGPYGVAVDSSNNLYIADTGNARIRKISDGVITTVVGQGTSGSYGEGILAINALLNLPNSVAVDGIGTLYIADGNNYRVRKVSNGIITTVAGNGTVGFSGDGSRAVDASLSQGVSIAVDSAGILYIADSRNSRVRVVKEGIIQTVAGDGAYHSSGDGNPSTTATLYFPTNIATDTSGNLYIADTYNNRIRKIAKGIISTIVGGDGSLNQPEGVAVDSNSNIYIADTRNQRIEMVSSSGNVTTIAGNGGQGFSGDGGLATDASLDSPAAVAVDTLGNIYIADYNNRRIRKVFGGIITTIAGDGSYGYSGDGVATAVSLGNPSALALDSAGNLYIADPYVNRVRKLSNGILTTIAGTGYGGSSGDGGPATRAALNGPLGVAVDKSGNIYISELYGDRIRQLSNGVITTIAGSGVSGYRGDGGLAVNAWMRSPWGVALDPMGNLYIADNQNNRIREVFSNAVVPSVPLPSNVVTLRALSSGKPAQASLEVLATLSGSPLTTVTGVVFSARVSSGNSWLSVSPPEGATPSLILVTANPLNLNPGVYEGAITLSFAYTNPSTQTVEVEFTVGSSVPPSPSVDHTHLSFTYSTTSAARTQTITVSNAGGGPLPFTASVSLNSGQGANWLTVTPSSAIATPATPAVLSVQGDPSQLPPGTYTGQIALASTGGTAMVSVTMTITTNPLVMLLSQTGLTFTAVQNGGAIPPQTFSVLNLGSGTLNWSAQTSVLGGVNNWLSATPANGTTVSASLTGAPVVTVSVNPAGLQPGVYYGLVTVKSSGAANTPQAVVVALQVLLPGTDVAPTVQPNALTFTSSAGNSSPGSQTVQVYDPTGTGKSYRSGIATVNGGNWLVILPTDATIPANQPVQMVVQPLVNNLSPGTYQGTVTLQFSDGRVSTVGIQFVVTAASSAGSEERSGGKARPQDASGACTPTQLLPSLLTLGTGFSLPAGYPQGLEAQVVDDCGSPQVEGTVFVQFNDGEAPVKLQSLGNGLWDGTWPVGTQTTSQVTLTVAAQNGATLRGQGRINGGLSAAMPAPQVATNGVVSAASLAAGAPVAPGELVSIFGQQLAGGVSPAGGGTLPMALSGTTVSIGSQAVGGNGTFQALPLLFASGGQVNAEVPFGTSVNTHQQVLLQWGTAYAPPVYVDVAAAAPGIFETGTQQGIIADAAGNLIGEGNPTHAGDVVVIYCAGLGAVTPGVGDGAVTPNAPLSQTQNAVTVTMGGLAAAVQFAGLTSGFNGLYQINAVVPHGVTPGDQVPVSITVAGQTSAVANLSVR